MLDLFILFVYAFLSAVTIGSALLFGYYMTKRKSNIFGKYVSGVVTFFGMLSIFAMSIILA